MEVVVRPHCGMVVVEVTDRVTVVSGLDSHDAEQSRTAERSAIWCSEQTTATAAGADERIGHTDHRSAIGAGKMKLVVVAEERAAKKADIRADIRMRVPGIVVGAAVDAIRIVQDETCRPVGEATVCAAGSSLARRVVPGIQTIDPEGIAYLQARGTPAVSIEACVKRCRYLNGASVVRVNVGLACAKISKIVAPDLIWGIGVSRVYRYIDPNRTGWAREVKRRLDGESVQWLVVRPHYGMRSCHVDVGADLDRRGGNACRGARQVEYGDGIVGIGGAWNRADARNRITAFA